MATVVGLFNSTNQAQIAVQELRDSGIAADNIGVAMRSAGTSEVALEKVGGTGASLATGAIGGGVLGGLTGLLIGVGAVTIGGLGPVVAAGPLASTLLGAGVGAGIGGLIGALVDIGLPEDDARLYHTGVERGGVLVTAHVPDGQEMTARDILNRNSARDIRNDAETLYSDPNYRYDTGATTRGDDKTNEAIGGAGGAVAGGLIGAAVGGPVGAAIGAGIGGAGGAVAADAAEGDDDEVGAGAGGAGGAVAGGAIGAAVAGPIGAVAGAAIGGAGGAAAGEAGEEEVTNETDTTYRTDVNRVY